MWHPHEPALFRRLKNDPPAKVTCVDDGGGVTTSPVRIWGALSPTGAKLKPGLNHIM